MQDNNYITIDGDLFMPTLPTYQNLNAVFSMVEKGMIVDANDKWNKKRCFMGSFEHKSKILYIQVSQRAPDGAASPYEIAEILPNKSCTPKKDWDSMVGYRPRLVPVCNNQESENPFKFDTYMKDNNRNGDIFYGGTLYCDGVPLIIPQNPINGGDILAVDGYAELKIGDTYSEETMLRWILIEGMLVADRVLVNTFGKTLFRSKLIV